MVAELQAKAPGVQGSERYIAETDADMEVDVAVLVSPLNTPEAVVDVDDVVECEVRTEVLFEIVDNGEGIVEG